VLQANELIMWHPIWHDDWSYHSTGINKSVAIHGIQVYFDLGFCLTTRRLLHRTWWKNSLWRGAEKIFNKNAQLFSLHDYGWRQIQMLAHLAPAGITIITDSSVPLAVATGNCQLFTNRVENSAKTAVIIYCIFKNEGSTTATLQ